MYNRLIEVKGKEWFNKHILEAFRHGDDRVVKKTVYTISPTNPPPSTDNNNAPSTDNNPTPPSDHNASPPSSDNGNPSSSNGDKAGDKSSSGNDKSSRGDKGGSQPTRLFLIVVGEFL
jgi:hypothetical protein